MSLPVFLRGISGGVARFAVSLGRGGQPTVRWQDKSRSLRRGRAVGECCHIKRFGRGAPPRDNLPLGTTPWHFVIIRTSRASTP